MRRSRLLCLLAMAGLSVATAVALVPQVRAASAAPKPSCSDGWFAQLCTEVDDYQNAFGYYVGHDEPSTVFYSNSPGSGNHMQYSVTLPTEPAEANNSSPIKPHSFQLSPAFWFGMAMCDTQSFPEQSKTCTPDSDSNIVDPTVAGSYRNAPGVAFQELQFYPPGWLPQPFGSGCDPTRWCAALNIDSLSQDPIGGKILNPACQSQILGGEEYVNFAFLTKSGSPIGPPNPLQFDPATSGNPLGNPNVFFMNQGDNITVSLHDTANGLETDVTDNTTHTSGLMVASAANGFGQIKFNPGKVKGSCQMLPYDFHPMYSTSSPKTRVLWAAHTYNVAMDVETGHFDACSAVDVTTSEQSCAKTATEGTDGEPSDGDDNFCSGPGLLPAPLLYQETGCIDSNDPGFDGAEYQTGTWPDALTAGSAPTPFLFTSPKSGANGSTSYATPYPDASLEADLPRIEDLPGGQGCIRFIGDHGNGTVGQNCTNPPLTDDNSPVNFYPYFSIADAGPGGTCVWGAGANWSSGLTGADNLGGSSSQYGNPLYTASWLFGGDGAPQVKFNNFNSTATGGDGLNPSTINMRANPC